MESEEMPEEGAYLELWVDIEEVGEPIFTYWQSDHENMFEAWLAWLDSEHDATVEISIQPDPDVEAWVVRTRDSEINGGGIADYWVKLREGF